MNRSRSQRKPAEKDHSQDTLAAGKSMEVPRPPQARTGVSPSRLPVKPSARPISTVGASKTGAAAAPGGLARSATTAGLGTRPGRPLSIYGGLTRSATTKIGAKGEAKAAADNKDGDEQGRRYPPSSSRAAGAAMASRPGTSSGTTSTGTSGTGTVGTRTRAQTAHSRGKSATTLTGSTILRPPCPPSTATATRQSSAAAKTRPPSQTSKARPTSAAAARIPSAASTSSADSYPSKTQKTQRDENPRLLRPAFSTLQQHYSPLKSQAPKPLTSTYLAPPSPSKLPTNIAISAETLKLQNELLRLHILHAAAPSTDAEWRASAKRRLGVRFAGLARESKEVSAEEVSRIERTNVLAIRRWGSTGAAASGRRGGGSAHHRSSMAAAGAMGLEEKIQVLDVVLAGVWGLGETGGKYARLARRFERWVEKAAEVERGRRAGRGEAMLDAHGDVVLVGEPDATWREECENVARKLEGWGRQLAELGDVPPPPGNDRQHGAKDRAGRAGASSLERVLEACRAVVRDMLAELALMKEIEGDVVRREGAWIRDMIGGEEDERARAGAIWRAI